MISVNNLSVGYHQDTPIHIPDFTLNYAESALILGQSGSGKTSLLYTMAGILPALSGDIILDNIDITKQTPTESDIFRGKNIGIIHQTLHLLPHLNVIDNILLTGYCANISVDKKTIVDFLKQLDILDCADKKPEYLSQGQKQRVAIIRSIIHKPKFIFGDEPTSALDDTACHNVITLLIELAKNLSAHLCISTHDARIKPYFHHVISLDTPHQKDVL
jgi:putative ABC transport system ATP-binding protein